MIASVELALLDKNIADTITTFEQRSILNRVVRFSPRYNIISIPSDGKSLSDKFYRVADEIAQNNSNIFVFHLYAKDSSDIKILADIQAQIASKHYDYIHIPYIYAKEIKNINNIILITPNNMFNHAQKCLSSNAEYILEIKNVASIADIIECRRELRNLLSIGSIKAVRTSWEHCYDEDTPHNLLSQSEKVKSVRMCYGVCTELKIPMNIGYITNYSYCGAEHSNHHIVTPSGEVYKCWHEYHTGVRYETDIYAIENYGKTLTKDVNIHRTDLCPFCYGSCTSLVLKEPATGEEIDRPNNKYNKCRGVSNV